MTELLAGHREELAEGAVLLHGYALPWAEALLGEVAGVAEAAPFRHMVTPGGHAMSVAMTNCGRFGWVSDRSGYRYSPVDPMTGAPWPKLPAVLSELAGRAAAEAGFPYFEPDVCLVNRYGPGTRMGLHQDRDEPDLNAPIVSISLGVAATFLFGGAARGDKARRFRLEHGDVVAWGGPARLAFHGIAPLPRGEHQATGAARINLTLRRAGPPTAWSMSAPS